jgi:hypothetical protein
MARSCGSPSIALAGDDWRLTGAFQNDVDANVITGIFEEIAGDLCRSIPPLLTVSIAAALAGMPRARMRRMIDQGIVASKPTGSGWIKVPLQAIEQMIGHEVTAAEYLTAERSLDKSRSYQQAYRKSQLAGDASKPAGASSRLRRPVGPPSPSFQPW